MQSAIPLPIPEYETTTVSDCSQVQAAKFKQHMMDLLPVVVMDWSGEQKPEYHHEAIQVPHPGVWSEGQEHGTTESGAAGHSPHQWPSNAVSEGVLAQVY